MELAAPITIYWDLPQGAADTGFLLRVCDDIVACRPLMLHLYDPAPVIGKGTVSVLERLGGGTIVVTLTIPPAALESTASALDPGPKEILLAAERVTALPERGGALFPVTGVSFTVTRENWQELPALVARCREERLARLILPMQRLYRGETPFFLNDREQRALTDLLATAGGVTGVNLTIHDPFLWRAFHPGLPFPQGGCQAANTMLAIAPDGAVYPCPTLPVRLGTLGETSLKDIVASSAKKELRSKLVALPADCRSCTSLAECQGGCRGRAYVLRGSLNGADGACT